MCQPRRKLQIAAIHEKSKINKKDRLIKMNLSSTKTKVLVHVYLIGLM